MTPPPHWQSQHPTTPPTENAHDAGGPTDRDQSQFSLLTIMPELQSDALRGAPPLNIWPPVSYQRDNPYTSTHATAGIGTAVDQNPNQIHPGIFPAAPRQVPDGGAYGYRELPWSVAGLRPPDPGLSRHASTGIGNSNSPAYGIPLKLDMPPSADVGGLERVHTTSGECMSSISMCISPSPADKDFRAKSLPAPSPISSYPGSGFAEGIRGPPIERSVSAEGTLDSGSPPRKNQRKHQCPECSKIFPRPSGLKTHMNSHNKIKPYGCPEPGCDKTFTVRSNARRHYRTHGGDPALFTLSTPPQNQEWTFSNHVHVHEPAPGVGPSRPLRWTPTRGLPPSSQQEEYNASEHATWEDTTQSQYNGYFKRY